METSQLLGILFLVMGLGEIPVGLFLILPRSAPHARPLILMALVGGALLQLALGLAFLLGYVRI